MNRPGTTRDPSTSPKIVQASEWKPLRYARTIRSMSTRRPIAHLVVTRVALGIMTLFGVSIIVFAATQLLPGNAAYAVLGRTGSAEAIARVESQLGLDRPAVVQYWSWLVGVLHGDFGVSLVNGQPVWSLIKDRLLNSAIIVVAAGILATITAVTIGIVCGALRNTAFDKVISGIALWLSALPEFVVAIGLVIVFSTTLLHILPAVSAIPPGVPPLANVTLLVLPVLALVLVCFPYIFRMTRAAIVEAIESEYFEWARLRGVSWWKAILSHALPNAIPMAIQAIGLNMLYLAGGIVLVEEVFNFPGLGEGLVQAVGVRDIPTIQAIVLLLAGVYVVINILADVLALLATPRRRFRRS